jgi:hypothetical protein
MNGADEHLANPVLNAFVSGWFDQVYLDAASFARFAALVPQVGSMPAGDQRRGSSGEVPASVAKGRHAVLASGGIVHRWGVVRTDRAP